MAVETTTFSNNSADTWFRDIMFDCVLCPRACHVNRLAGQTGYCGQTAELMAARASLHYWEEPCISGTSGSGTIFFSGCNLRCVFCQNHNIALGKAGRVIAPEHLAEIFLQLQEQGANNINLVTPTHFLPQIVIALVLACWFTDARLKLHGKQFFKVVIYLPNLIMASAFSMLFFTLFSDGGPINSILMQIGIISEPYKFLANTGSARGLIALMNCLMWFGNTTILLMAGMMGIDTSLFEAAEVDGATSTQVFYKITLPLLRPILVYVVITSLIGGLQLFDVPQILTNGTGDPMRSTMTLIMFLNKHLYSKNYGMAGAVSVILFIITAILSLIVFKVTGNDKRKA